MVADWLAEDERPLTPGERAEAISLAAALGNATRIEHVLTGCPAA